jgi:formylmethanofuran--tetrahydromethanopterin N-formyltransferase
MEINGVEIEDTFAEAFPMVAARAIITADARRWAEIAGRAATGYATSVIACDAEAGIEQAIEPDASPDGRPGVSLLFFGFSRDKLEKAVTGRVGQCVMTCATTACYNGLGGTEKSIRVGGNLRYFGDGFQTSKLFEDWEPETANGPGMDPEHGGPASLHPAAADPPRAALAPRRRFWRVPVMDGEFLCEDRFGVVQGVGGGNFLILAESAAVALAAAERAVQAIDWVPGVITPFPGGVVRSGSKVGSRYKKLRASTNEAYCPTLRGVTTTALPGRVAAVYEIVIDGLDLAAVVAATAAGVRAACLSGVVQISAGNYGGSLGPHHIRLHEALGR